MTGRKSRAAVTPAPAVTFEPISEIIELDPTPEAVQPEEPEQPVAEEVSFEPSGCDIDGDDADFDDDEGGDGDDEDEDDECMFDPFQQLSQLFVTEDGTPLVDVVHAIQETLDKQNKILFKLVSVLDAKLR